MAKSSAQLAKFLTAIQKAHVRLQMTPFVFLRCALRIISAVALTGEMLRSLRKAPDAPIEILKKRRYPIISFPYPLNTCPMCPAQRPTLLPEIRRIKGLDFRTGQRRGREVEAQTVWKGNLWKKIYPHCLGTSFNSAETKTALSLVYIPFEYSPGQVLVTGIAMVSVFKFFPALNVSTLSAP